jgi:hypothetical protein
MILLSALSIYTCSLAEEEARFGKLTEILFRIDPQAFLWFSRDYFKEVPYYAKSIFFLEL